MITLHNLKWSHAFSYGAENSIDLSGNPLTQLVGKNGHGKTSIALILEEVLYNKNSKGIKKADVLNRYAKEKAYTIELTFSKDNNKYKISSRRGSTQTVAFERNGVDISAHTATATYKMIEEVIGMDHKTFSQIVFQSSASSLEFLTATDTVRKKFLIDLFNLAKYTEAGELFKSLSKPVEKAVAVCEGKIANAKSWLEKNKSVPARMEPVEVPVASTELQATAIELQSKLTNIKALNKKILDNVKYKELLDGIVIVDAAQPSGDAAEMAKAKTLFDKSIADAKAFIDKMNKLGDKCPTCLQGIDKHKVQDLVSERATECADLNAKLADVKAAITKFNAETTTYSAAKAARASYEQYHSLYDPTLPTQIYSKEELEEELASVTEKITTQAAAQKRAVAHNNTVAAHNARIDVLLEQQIQTAAQLDIDVAEKSKLETRLSHLEILVKTFSTTGLVAYKLECLVKDLEQVSNEYLSDLSYGRFQLGFEISTSDKLNVVISDNGRSVDILALSGGERARVNVATLLGIRKILQSISSSRINLLFLDETIENLDAEGKDKLVEVLVKEEHLNTFLVSHGFQHPLLEKVFVVKNNNISRIE